MPRPRRVASLALTILLGATLPALAQTGNDATGSGPGDRDLSDFARPRRMIYFYETEPGALSEYERFLLYNSILTDASQANEAVVIVESPDLAVPVTRAGREELARRVDADAWMHVYVAGGLDDLTVRITLYDMTAGETVAEPTIRPGFPVSLRTLARGFWDELVTELADGFVPLVATGDVVVRGIPGTVLSNIPGGPYRIGADGVASFALPIPATYALDVRLEGFIPVVEEFYLGDEPRELRLVQLQAYRFAVDALASSFQFPGARFRYHIVPGRWFARVGAITQYVGLNFVPNRPLVSRGASLLSTVYLDAGTMLGELDSFTRYLVAVGGLLRLRHEPLGLENDFAFGGAHLSLGIELSPWRSEPFLRILRFFADYQPTWFFTAEPALFLERSLAWNAFPGGNVPLIYPLPYGVVDLRDLTVGIRVAW